MRITGDYIPQVMLQWVDSCLVVKQGLGSEEAPIRLDKGLWLSLLEIFAHEHNIESAYQAYQRAHDDEVKAKRSACRSELEARGLNKTVFSRGKFVLQQDQFLFLLREKPMPLKEVSAYFNYSLLVAFFSDEGTTADDVALHDMALNDFASFTQEVSQLVEKGLLVRAPEKIDWGDLRRRIPISREFGFDRGTPIDRYYLDRFLAVVRSQVKGTTLEVGGDLKNRAAYQLQEVSEYHALDLQSRTGVTHVGDVMDRSLFHSDTFDSILIFNVLEHLPAPWIAVQHLHHWLKKGGKVFAMVPNAQRLHRFPRDYWRPLPDGMEALFAPFVSRQLYLYGNPLTVLASLMGIAKEELNEAELNYYHPDYPVATCIIAEK